MDTDLVGLNEIARRGGWRYRTVVQWRHRALKGQGRKPMPDPVHSTSGRELWSWPAVEAWARETGRLT